jgi:putative transposase
MLPPTRVVHRYDHRLRDLVHSTSDSALARKNGVPRSTAAGWIKNKPKATISIEPVASNPPDLLQEVIRLRSQVAKLRSLLRLVFLILRISGFKLERFRIPTADAKSQLIRAANKAMEAIPKRSVLAVVGLSYSRYHAWTNAECCQLLADHSSCPKTRPNQLTSHEITAMRDMVEDKNLLHLTTCALVRLGRKLGKVFASQSCWFRIIRKQGWKRPRYRIYPEKPKVGIRASKPNEIWHIDTSILRLFDGTRVYMHAIIDNFSRRILAWCVDPNFDMNATARLITEASKGLKEVEDKSSPPQVYMDSGIENVNAGVSELIEAKTIRRVLAQVDIHFSNSMIESWWRQLKHQWLFLNTLDSIQSVRKLVAFYVQQHNEIVPHSAFQGQTPDEMFHGTGADVPDKLKAAQLVAKQVRREANLARSCPACQSEPKTVAIEKATAKTMPSNTS